MHYEYYPAARSSPSPCLLYTSSESDLEDWDAAITKGEAVRLFTTMSFMYYHVAGDGSLMDEIAENIIYPDVNPEDVDPKATNIDGDIAFALGKQEFNEVTEEYRCV